MTRFAWILAGALILAPATSSAQGEHPALLARLKPPARAAVDALVDSLRRAGLPVEPLYDKAAEGVLKGADDARVVDAVRALAVRLHETSAALGPSATAAELTAGASALYAGAPASLLRRIVDARDGSATRGTASSSLALPFVVLANLLSRGVPSDAAGATMTTLVARGVRDDELQAFRTGVERDIRDGVGARAATAKRSQDVLRAIEARTPRRGANAR